MVGFVFWLSTLAPLYDFDTSFEEIHCLAEAIYHESRGESELGQALVAQTILNRVISKDFRPGSICSVVKQKGQFEFLKWYSEEHVHDEKLYDEIYDRASMYVFSYRVGREIVPQEYKDVTFFCTCMFTGFKYGDVLHIGKVDNHNFFKL